MKLYENYMKKFKRDAKLVMMWVVLLTMIGITLTALIFYRGFLSYLRVWMKL